jgi:glutamate-ammonia-ligase adenylyltransferase
VPFADAIETETPGEPAWLTRAREALKRAPDPVAARTLAAHVLDAVDPDALARAAAREPERLGVVLRALCGVAPFFAPYLERNPDWILDLLATDLAQPRDAEALRGALRRALDGDTDTGGALRRFKYRELGRITVRDCEESLVPLDRTGETLKELSRLAVVLLEAAFDAALATVRARYGPARWRGAAGNVELGFCVLALGKLGADELNFSSDVDLVYVHETPASELALGKGDHATLGPTEYFTALAQAFGRLVQTRSEDGFLFRVDLDLRPEGAQGPIVTPDVALADYYEVWAESWEKAAFMKARPVAGDQALGRRAIAAVAPMIHRSAMDHQAVEAIRTLKQKIAQAHAERDDGFDVKLDAGGIRDVEFVAQALQLLHGGRVPDVRARGTEESLARLAEARLLPRERAESLRAAYHFLRRLEHRLQMEGERQTHLLPLEPAARVRFARAMGFTEPDALRAFETALATHQRHVREAFEAFFFDRGADRIFAAFTRQVPRLAAVAPTHAMLRELAAQFAEAIDACADPARALDNLEDFVRGVGDRPFYYELLLDRPELVPRLTRLFAASKYLSDILASHPRLIEPVFHDPAVLLLDRAALRTDLAGIEDECRTRGLDEDEVVLAALRLFRHRQVLNVGLLDVDEKIDHEAVEKGLSEIAEVCVERALVEADRWLSARREEWSATRARLRFSVIGMGKLASRELSYGSDLDLLFVFDVEPAAHEAPGGTAPDALADAQEGCTRLAQRMISLLSTRTAEGSCYEVDTRLRPSGNQGSLVTSLGAFARYHASDAAMWERQALLRARPIAGDPALGAAFATLRGTILRRPLPPDAEAAIHHVRERMERELARETRDRRHVKLGRGGALDVETVVQFLQLRHGSADPTLLGVERVERSIARLARSGHLATEPAVVLAAGWTFLQSLSGRLRLVDNRSIADLDAERGDLEGIARHLGFPTGEREGDARRALFRAYEEHSERIRAVYRSVLGGAAGA